MNGVGLKLPREVSSCEWRLKVEEEVVSRSSWEDAFLMDL